MSPLSLALPLTFNNAPSYFEHCNSIVPESTPTTRELTGFSFPRNPITYISGGSPFLTLNSSAASLKCLYFHTQTVFKTSLDGVLKVEATLILTNTLNRYYYGYNNYSAYGHSQDTQVVRMSRFSILKFRLSGFWSEASGKICMVGLGATYLKQGDFKLDAVFKLNYVKNSSIIYSLDSGTLESLSSVHDSNYFEPISILIFTEMNYQYSLVLEEIDNGCFNGSDVPPSLSLRSQPGRWSLCSIFSSFNQLELTYSSNSDSAKNCTPFGGRNDYLPHGMSLNSFECSEENHRLRVLLKFFKKGYGAYYPSFKPNTILIGEGFSDGK